jgi:DNA polymerase III delta subunit
LSPQEDPYALFALLTSQANTLAAVAYADGDDVPAKDFAIHPFVASKLSRHAKRLGKGRVAHIIEAFAKTDADMKRSRAEPWLLIQQLLLTIAR